jgi:ABC-2 type transport system permease protein
MILVRWLLERLFGRRLFGRGGPDTGGRAAGAGAGGNGPVDMRPDVGARAMELELSNVVAVARREYLARARTRTFRLTTILLVVVGLGIALAPVLIRWFDQGSGPTTIELSIGDSKPSIDISAALGGIINATPGTSPTGAAPGTAKPTYAVAITTDIAAARARVDSGKSGGLLIVTRPTADGGLAFTFVSKARAIDRISQLVRAAASAIAVEDRLNQAGISPIDQAKLFAPAPYVAESPSGAADKNDTAEGFVNQFAIGFILAIILFMAIILYGQWVAYSVAEEKSSRVMEVILGAASPFELLAGKVAGVGGLALTQYAIIFVPAALALLFQDQIAARILGQTASTVELPAGLSIGLLVVFGLMFILGFSLYAVLYAGAAALVSRTEDINQIVAPMTLVSTAGYLVAVYSSTGLIPPDSPLVVGMSYIPFFSPYLVLSRLGAGAITPLEVAASIAILALTVPIALWVAARLYAAGVLMYGQRPSLRLMFRVLRGS